MGQASRILWLVWTCGRWGQQRATRGVEERVGGPDLLNPWFWETGSKSRHLKMGQVL